MQGCLQSQQTGYRRKIKQAAGTIAVEIYVLYYHIQYRGMLQVQGSLVQRLGGALKEMFNAKINLHIAHRKMLK